MAVYTDRLGPNNNAYTAGDIWIEHGVRRRFDGTAWQAVAYISAAGTALAASGNAALDWTLGNVFTLTPTGSQNITCTTVPPIGYECSIIVLTVGTSSYTQTFTTNFTTTGTLASGTADAKYFIMKFISNGVSLIEVSRTAAMP